MIDIDAVIAGSSYDPETKICTYLIRQGGKQWTLSVPESWLQSLGGKEQQRAAMTSAVEHAMRGTPDDEYKSAPADPTVPAGVPSEMDRATVTWAPEWVEFAQERIAGTSVTLGENRHGYLVLMHPKWHAHVPISFEGIDRKSGDAFERAQERIRAAVDELQILVP